MAVIIKSQNDAPRDVHQSMRTVLLCFVTMLLNHIFLMDPNASFNLPTQSKCNCTLGFVISPGREAIWKAVRTMDCYQAIIRNAKDIKVKVKSLFWVHIQAQSSALQTLTSTFPGHWAFYCPYPSGYPYQLPGGYTAAHTQLDATAYKSALTGTHFLLGREKQCSGKYLAHRHNEQSHRLGI